MSNLVVHLSGCPSCAATRLFEFELWEERLEGGPDGPKIRSKVGCCACGWSGERLGLVDPDTGKVLGFDDGVSAAELIRRTIEFRERNQ